MVDETPVDRGFFGSDLGFFPSMKDFSLAPHLTLTRGSSGSAYPMPPALRCYLFLLAGLCAVPCVRSEPAPAVSVPRFTHPGAGQTVYFLLTDRFANGSTANDTGGYAGGPDQTGFDPTRLSHYHGGDFAGLMAKLDYIKGLGATAVWVTPPFKNKPMQEGTAGYHGYWILDFLQIDPHLGSNAEFAEFVRQAHARGLKVYMDIIVNHTADVIQYEGGNYTYRPKKDFPYRDAQGRVLDDHAAAYNGLGDPAAFPALSAVRSFPYVPTVPAAEKNAKNPAWLNDVTLYHNRGNSTFQGENAVYGDFGGLDDVFTEQPRVVQGFIDLFSEWLKAGVDGYRITEFGSPSDIMSAPSTGPVLARHFELLLGARSSEWVNRSLAFYREQRYQESLDAAKQALTFSRDNALAWNNVAAAQASLQQWEAAVEAATEALRLDPQLRTARANLAWAQTERDKASAAPR